MPDTLASGSVACPATGRPVRPATDRAPGVVVVAGHPDRIRSQGEEIPRINIAGGGLRERYPVPGRPDAVERRRAIAPTGRARELQGHPHVARPGRGEAFGEVVAV